MRKLLIINETVLRFMGREGYFQISLREMANKWLFQWTVEEYPNFWPA